MLAAALLTAVLTHADAPASDASLSDTPPPNLVVILADDMGFSDLGCYGGEIPTPHLDRLAAGGLRYTRFYNTGRCCPTRAALLTGRYPHAVGVGHMTGDRGPEHPAFRGHLGDTCATFGELLRPAGYFTAHTGKWHVGSRTAAMRPLGRGFDRFFGVPEGGGFYYELKPKRTVRLGDEIVYSADKPTPDGWYTTDAWTDHGIEFLDEARAAGKPFLLYLAHNAPHFPLQAPRDSIERFRGKFLEGWDVLRERRLARQRELGLFGDEVSLPARQEAVKPWAETTPAERDRFDHIMACYAAVMAEMDDSVGRLTAALEERGELENTLILFLSDNGASAEGGDYGRLEGAVPGSADSSVYEGRAWATLSNTPFRRHKMSSHEGGIATPLIAHWPAGLPDGSAGTFRRQVGHVIDLVPTLLDVAGAGYPAKLDGRDLRRPHGVSLAPTFADADADLDRGPLFWEHEGNRAVRVGDEKLVAVAGRPWELYDLSTDRSETHDLAADRPDRVRELAALWNDCREEMGFERGEWRGR